jgi:MATE family multidrug resistance protein
MTLPLSPSAHARAILALGVPLIGSHLAQMALHVTDTVMLGWYGVAPLAAGVLGSTCFFVVFVLGSGFAHAVMPMVAAALGRRDEVQVRRIARMGLWLSILYGIVCYPIFWFSGAILLGLGQNPEVAGLTQDFLRLAGLGMTPALLIMVLKSYLAALERTQVVLWVTLGAVVVNAMFGWALIFGHWGAPELGVVGAAIASVVVQFTTALALAIYAGTLPALRHFHLFQRFWRPDWQALGQVFQLGWPIGVTGLSETGLFTATSIMMGWIGTMELAAHGITLQAVSVTFMLHVGLSNAATVRAGRAYGARDWPELRMGARVAILLSMIIAAGIILVFLIMPQAIIAAFLDMSKPESAGIVSFGAGLLIIGALFQLADAAQVMALGLLRGVQDTKVPLMLAAVSYWVVGIPSSYLLAFHFGMGGKGLWLGLVIGLVVAATLLMIRFWSHLRRNQVSKVI